MLGAEASEKGEDGRVDLPLDDAAPEEVSALSTAVQYSTRWTLAMPISNAGGVERA